MQSVQVNSPSRQKVEEKRLTRPMFDHPQEEVTQKGRKLIVQFQSSRPIHEPFNSALQSSDGIETQDFTDLFGNPGSIVDNVKPKRDSNNHIVRY